jgi:hypothetical protein
MRETLSGWRSKTEHQGWTSYMRKWDISEVKLRLLLQYLILENFEDQK